MNSMTTISVAEAKDKFYQLVDDCASNNDTFVITGENGRNVVLLDEDEWRGMLETIYINSVPGLAESIISERGKSRDELIPESEIEW